MSTVSTTTATPPIVLCSGEWQSAPIAPTANAPPASTPRLRPALFLDRDGVINVDRAYVHRPADFSLVPGIIPLLQWAYMQGLPVIVVSNQSGIGRGFFSADTFHAFTVWMCTQLAAWTQVPAPLTAIYACSDAPTATPVHATSYRKPGAGMLWRAAQDWSLDLPRSVLIGDNLSDMRAATHADLQNRYLLQTKSPESVIIPPNFAHFTSLEAIKTDLVRKFVSV